MSGDRSSYSRAEFDVKGLAESLLFLVAAELLIQADLLYLESDRDAAAGKPNRAYNRRREGDRLMRRARGLVGGKGLPWGVR